MPLTHWSAKGGRAPFSGGWLALAAVVAACCLASAQAGEPPYHNSKTVGNAKSWIGQDVDIEADGTTTKDIVVEVTGGGYKVTDPISETAGDLTITANDKYSAELLFNGAADMTVIFDSASLSGVQVPDGKSGTSRTATITVKGTNNVVRVTGETELGESSRLVVNGAGNGFWTDSLVMKGAGTGKNPLDAVATITNGGGLYVHGTANILENAKLRVDSGGTAIFNDAANVGGSSSKGNALVELNGGNIVLGAKNEKAGTEGSLTVGDGGILSITGTGTSSITQIGLTKDSPGVDIVGGGRLVVDATATLEVDMLQIASQYNNPDDPDDKAGAIINGTVNAGYFRAYGNGLVDVNGTLNADNLTITGDSVVNVNAKAKIGETTPGGPDNIITVSGGTLNLLSDGTIEYSTLRATGGTVNVKSGGILDVEDFEAAGTSTVNVSGTITAGSSFKVDGVAKATFTGGAKIGDGGHLGHLGVAGDGTLDILATVTTDSFAFGGGNINLSGGGSLTAEAAGAPFGVMGNLNFLDSNSSATFKGDVIVSKGGIFAKAMATGHMSLSDGITNHALTIAQGAVLDTTLGNMEITGVSNFSLYGTLNIGYQNNQVLIATITGMGSTGGSLEVGGKATVTMTNAMQRQAMASVNSGGLEILKTDAKNFTGTDTFYWDNVSVRYEYKVVRDPSTNEYSIWVKGVQAASRETLYETIISSWREHPKIGGYVNNVVNGSLLDAIVDANYIAIGITPGYDTMDPSGQFNADLLASLVNPAQTGAGYDALMLYNGSGLNMANQAVVSSNAHFLRRISRRSEDLRREIRGNDQIDPDSELPEPLPVNRFWAEGVYMSDNSGHDQGFGGYAMRGSGLMVGHDRLYGDLVVGGAIGYLDGHFKDSSAQSNSSRIDTYALDLYALLSHPSGWFVSGTIGYGYSDNDIRDRRTLNGVNGWNHADFGSHTLAVSASFGRDLWLGDAWTVSPSLGIDYVGTRSSSHTQYFTGAGRGADTLLAGQIRNHSATIPLNLGISYNMPTEEGSLLTLTGNVGYAYELNNDGASGNINYSGLVNQMGPVKIARRAPGQHLFNIGLRGKYYFRQYELGLGYDYVGKKKYNSHTFSLNGGVSF